MPLKSSCARRWGDRTVPRCLHVLTAAFFWHEAENLGNATT
jgi:hypothetical protein